MAKLHFKYATMNSGKTIDLIRTAYNYEENGAKVLILKPKIDTKGDDKISSRIGLERKVDYLVSYDESVLETLKGKLNDVKCILVDEAQFLSKVQIDELNLITKSLNIPVLCYGLRVNFKNELFNGSKRLMEVSDELEPLLTLCECTEIARFVGRKVNGEYTLDGEEVLIDGSDKNVEYVPLCGKCFLKKVKKIDLDSIKKDME
jgi:thymidine kinase